jgi:predicted nucleic acid-binding protein
LIILDTNSLVQMMVVDETDDDAARLRGLMEKAKASGISLGIPAPVFAEFLVRTDDATTEMLNAFERRQAVRILPFDKRAAHECALLDRAALATGDKRGGSKVSWQKLKIDRQIIAIARVNSAQLLLTNDSSLRTLANRLGLPVQTVADLPIPDDAKQRPLDLSPAAAPAPGSGAV